MGKGKRDWDDPSKWIEDDLSVGVRGGYQPETDDIGGPPSGGGGGKEPGPAG